MKHNFLTLLALIGLLFITSCSSDDDGPQEPQVITIDGATVAPDLGGANMGNQVFIDLSTNTTTTINRTSWDLGFSSAQDRVVINGSILMMAAELSATDINAVSSSNTEVQSIQPQAEVGNFNPANMAYVDAPNGSLSGTAIATISATDASNKVYLLNLGYEVGTEEPDTGSSNYKGEARGWKKIRILKNGNDYTLQYADLDDTTFESVTISKNNDYNFTFFSFNTESIVNVEPQKDQWDLCYTIFTNEAVFGGTSYGAYAYADYILNNIKTDAKAYMIDEATESITYEEFTIADVIEADFTTDQRSIGSSWRNGGGPGTSPSLKDDIFYVVNDANGNYYKLQFLALTNAEGVRGYPQFQYELLEESN
ncbi:HmuY family protein [Winogradskyella sp.]|jgi:hypothetical protein|uniref:HmuY family protein n=1 Tax=Winogradskyella sp. TaxID=1883156 RepID=UPI0025D560BF|nr:HmuY family protein [Winogradskyella sp.]MCT4628628.1 HmuY family protein [Winogradskyella sp.]